MNTDVLEPAQNNTTVATNVESLGSDLTSGVGTGSKIIPLTTALGLRSSTLLPQEGVKRLPDDSGDPVEVNLTELIDGGLTGGSAKKTSTTIDLTVEKPLSFVQGSSGLTGDRRGDTLEVIEIIDLTADSPEVIDLTGELD
ncbi:hypothetical protein PQX77_013486 [Marasmius sp. AFHP31]|nr:hypothetical protein PQX77_013486 [Marasmius sp. AFHP31]